MASIKTSSKGVKLHVGSKSGAYRSTNQVVRTTSQHPAQYKEHFNVPVDRSTNQVVRTTPQHPAQYKEHFNVPVDKVHGSGPYEAAASPTPTGPQPFCYFGQTSLVPANAETTLVSYVVDANQTVILQGFQACGDADATYVLYVNNQIVAVTRTSPTNLNAYLDLMGGTPIVPSGVTIKLTVTCTVGGLWFYGTLLGIAN